MAAFIINFDIVFNLERTGINKEITLLTSRAFIVNYTVHFCAFFKHIQIKYFLNKQKLEFNK